MTGHTRTGGFTLYKFIWAQFSRPMIDHWLATSICAVLYSHNWLVWCMSDVHLKKIWYTCTNNYNVTSNNSSTQSSILNYPPHVCHATPKRLDFRYDWYSMPSPVVTFDIQADNQQILCNQTTSRREFWKICEVLEFLNIKKNKLKWKQIYHIIDPLLDAQHTCKHLSFSATFGSQNGHKTAPRMVDMADVHFVELPSASARSQWVRFSDPYQKLWSSVERFCGIGWTAMMMLFRPSGTNFFIWLGLVWGC